MSPVRCSGSGALRAGVALCVLLAAGGVGRQAAAAEAHTGESTSSSEEQLQRQLDAARRRLEEAAEEVAQLSVRMGAGDELMFLSAGRGVIGLQLDPASGPTGARILEVSPGGPAEEAGVHAGDVIVAVDGDKIAGDNPARQVLEQLRHSGPGREVKLRVLRAGKPREFTVTARSRFAVQVGPLGPLGPLGPEVLLPRVRTFDSLPEVQYFHELGEETSGMELATLTPALGSYFGTDHGVLVLRAPSSGALHLRDGDVILSIDGREPRSGAHATRILRSYQPGERITLRILREKQPVTLTATLPELPGSAFPGAMPAPASPHHQGMPATPDMPATPPVPPLPPAPAEAPGTL